jgi:hypothetical protein
VKLPLAISLMKQIAPKELEKSITISTSAKDMFE